MVLRQTYVASAAYFSPYVLWRIMMRTKFLVSTTVVVVLVAGASLFAFGRSKPAATLPKCAGGACCTAPESSSTSDECCIECLQCCALDGCCAECLECCLAMGCGDCFVSVTNAKPSVTTVRPAPEFHTDVTPAADSADGLKE